MNNELRTTKYTGRRTQDGFTLVELVVAIGIMVMVILFAGTVFKASINSYRIASAQADIMQKFRAITNQLNTDFQGLQKDGYLILYSQNLPNRTEYPGAPLIPFIRSDRLYFFATGDFQSWYDSTIRSNIARIYLGHEGHFISDSTIYVNQWRLAHDILLLSPGVVWPDVNGVSYAQCRANPITVLNDANSILIFNPPDVNVSADPNTIRRLFCENAGWFQIEWSDGYSTDLNGVIAWFGLGLTRTVGAPPAIPPDARYNSIESFGGSSYKAAWQPTISADLWPRAIKFTFTLYDSKGVFKDGQTFTHIVYLGD
jgi:prepilin-type N-terminal cleavage/methylation domain-containing protein